MVRTVTDSLRGDTESVTTFEARHSVLQLTLPDRSRPIRPGLAVGGLQQSVETVAGPLAEEVFSAIEALTARFREEVAALPLVAVVIALRGVIADIVLDEMVIFVARTAPLI